MSGLDDGTGSLPDVELNDLDLSFRVWRLMRAFDWRFAPDVIARQDEALLDDLLTIEDIYQRMTKK